MTAVFTPRQSGRGFVGDYCKLKPQAGKLEKKFSKGDAPMGLGMGDEEGNVPRLQCGR